MMATKAKVYKPPQTVRRKNGFTIFFAQPPRAVTNFHPNKDVESKVYGDVNNLLINSVKMQGYSMRSTSSRRSKN